MFISQGYFHVSHNFVRNLVSTYIGRWLIIKPLPSLSLYSGSKTPQLPLFRNSTFNASNIYDDRLLALLVFHHSKIQLSSLNRASETWTVSAHHGKSAYQPTTLPPCPPLLDWCKTLPYCAFACPFLISASCHFHYFYIVVEELQSQRRDIKSSLNETVDLRGGFEMVDKDDHQKVLSVYRTVSGSDTDWRAQASVLVHHTAPARYEQ